MNDFCYRAQLCSEFLAKYIRKKTFGPLDGNTRIRSPTSAHYKPKYPCIQDGGTHQRPFLPDHIVDLEEAAMGWVLRLH